MGSTAADTQREIGELRSDATAALGELRARLAGGAATVARAEARITSVRTRAQATAQVRERPIVAVAAGGVALAVLGVAAFAAYQRGQERKKPRNVLKRRVRGARGELESRLEGPLGRIEDLRKRAEEARERGLLLKVEREGDGYLRVLDARLDMPNTSEGKRQEVLKNVVWAALLAIMMAASGVVGRRLATSVWRTMLREDPPSDRK